MYEATLERATSHADLSKTFPYGLRMPEGRMITAAASSGNILAVATIERIASELFLRPDLSGFYELTGREQIQMLLFSSGVAESVAAWKLDHMLVRISPKAGPKRADALAYKMEAALQLLGDLDVDVVASQSVSVWVNNHSTPLPAPCRGLGAALGKIQTRAIETAAYALRNDQQ